MDGLLAWSAVLFPSGVIGILCAFFIKGKMGLMLAGTIPWLGVLAGYGAMLCLKRRSPLRFPVWEPLAPSPTASQRFQHE